MAVCTDAPAACVSRSGVPAIGMLAELPAGETVTTSAPPSTLVLSITTNAASGAASCAGSAGPA